jgi:hypothetical protein
VRLVEGPRVVVQTRKRQRVRKSEKEDTAR